MQTIQLLLTIDKNLLYHTVERVSDKEFREDTPFLSQLSHHKIYKGLAEDCKKEPVIAVTILEHAFRWVQFN